MANLPLRHKAESYGSARIGRVAAYALRARIALNWKKYDLAASSAKQALNLAKEAGFELESINTQYVEKVMRQESQPVRRLCLVMTVRQAMSGSGPCSMMR